jgi:RHS repeat-associated protein
MTSIPKPADMTGGFSGIYDAWDRPVEVKDGANTVAKYEYDGFSGRIVKVTYNGGSPSETRHYYFSSAWRVLEERVGSSTSPDRQYLWGRRYVDELIFRDRDTDANGTLDERLYALQDANFNITAIADTSGAVAERFSYTPYGQRTILTPSWGARSSSLYAWDAGHQGLTHDTETGLIANRYRYLHPLLGRFTQRDPIGYLGGSMGLYEYVGGDPIAHMDPSGTRIVWAFPEGEPPTPKTVGEAMIQYNRLKLLSPWTLQLILELETSRATIVLTPNRDLYNATSPLGEVRLVPGSPWPEVVPLGDPADPANPCLKVGVNWDPFDRTPMADEHRNPPRDPMATLGHELYHARDAIRGRLSRNKAGIAWDDEIRASMFENHVRLWRGLPPRNTYWGRPIPPFNGPDTSPAE